jgi:protein-S-isoprenylcysteine O-methyltransferase Ste14
MDRRAAAAGSAVFFVVAPGVVAGLVPWWLTGWRAAPVGWPLRGLGWVLVVAGTVLLVACFSRFVGEGRGTPAPVAPTAHLVIGGVYRYLRNPMYVGVVAAIAGQALILGRPVLWAYAAVAAATMVAFVLGYEQPALRHQFGAEYDAYRAAVPAWWPRRTPWRPSP